MRFLMALIILFSNVALAEVGFWPVEHSRIPEKVREAAKSVYQIYLPFGSGVDVDYRKLEQTKLKVTSDYQAGKIPQQQYLLILQEIKRCQVTDNQGYFCKLSLDDFLRGSMFSLGHQRAGTALHSLQYFISRILEQTEIIDWSASKQRRFILGVRIPAVVRRHDGELQGVFLKVDQISMATIEAFRQRSHRQLNDLQLDGVLLSVDGLDIGPGLVIAKSRPATDEIAYGLGFPVSTQNRLSHFGVPDSSGYDLRVTIGNTLNMENYISELAEKFEDGKLPEGLIKNFGLDESAILVRSDLKFGMSGGPLVNSSGEVVGVIHSSMGAKDDVGSIAERSSVSLCMKYLTRAKK